MKFSAMLRLMEMIPEWDKRANGYANKLADALEQEGYITDAKVVRDHIKWRNGEPVAMAVMDKDSDEPKPVDVDAAMKNLEEEIERYFDGWCNDFEYGQAVMDESRGYLCAGVSDCKEIARHFAEWGAEHLAKQS